MAGQGRMSGTERRNERNCYTVHDGFPPCSVAEENASKGWLKTTMPEGAPFSELAELITSGSRGGGTTGEQGNKTVGRVKKS